MTSYDFYISNKEIDKHSKDCMRGSWGTTTAVGTIALIVCLLPIVVTVLVSIFTFWWLSIPLGLVCLLIIGIMGYGLNKYCLKLAKQELPTKNEIFAAFSKRMKSVIALALKRFFFSILWLIMLVFPVITKNIGWSMSTLLLADDPKMNSETAPKESKHLLKQNYGRYVKFLFSNIHWFLLTLFTGFIAWIWVGPIILTKKAIFYENLKTDF